MAPLEDQSEAVDSDVHALPIPGTGGAYYNSNNAASKPPTTTGTPQTIPVPPPLPESDINNSLLWGIPPPPPLPFT